MEQPEHVDVLIVGAGIAGCAAAKHLVENDISNIAVLEGSDVIGGRVKTITLESGCGTKHKLEIGAQWIHGNESVIYQEMSKINPQALAEDFPHEVTMYLSGERVLTNEEKKFYRKMRDQIDENIRNHWVPDGDKTIGQFKEQCTTELCNTMCLTEEQKKIFKGFLRRNDAIENIMEPYYPFDGSHVVNTDVTGYHAGDGDHTVEDGNSSVIDNLLLPTIENNIKLNHPVDSILWANGSKVSVHVKDQKFTADHVICTPSLGYIAKHHTDLFEPALPEDKQQAIDKLVFGLVEKYCFVYDATSVHFLNKTSFGFVFTDEAIKDLEPIMLDILSEKMCWWKEASVLYSPNPHTFILWLSNDAAHQANNCTDSQLIHAMAALMKYFTCKELPLTCQLIRSNWESAEFVLGSYASITKDHSPELTSTMLEPIYDQDKPAILFAGEAYHPDCLGTMHGAYDTGIIQAKKIIEYKRSTSS